MTNITSTYFYKGQLPGVDLDRLKEQYKKEIIIRWHAEEIVVSDDAIEFDKIAQHRSGAVMARTRCRLDFRETDTQYIVYLLSESFLLKLSLLGVYFTNMRNDIERELINFK